MTWLDRVFSEKIILAAIFLNAFSIGVETVSNLPGSIQAALRALDMLCLSFFVVEILIRIHRWRLSFFRDPWNIFDFIVVSIALVPASGPLSILRTMRILRALRVISVVPKLRQVVLGLLRALPGLGAVLGMLFLIFYVGSVLATGFFGGAFPDWFGSLGASSYTLFQVMTLESWSMGIVRPIMEQFPLAWMFFLPFILVTTFTMLNLFIAVIVNSMQIDTEEEAKKRAKEGHNERVALFNEIRALRMQVKVLADRHNAMSVDFKSERE